MSMHTREKCKQKLAEMITRTNAEIKAEKRKTQSRKRHRNKLTTKEKSAVVSRSLTYQKLLHINYNIIIKVEKCIIILNRLLFFAFCR